MKKATAFILISFFAVQTAFAGSAGGKLVRGLEGIVTSPLEYLNQYMLSSNTNGFPASVFVTVFGGTYMTVKRIVNGAYDVVSFPVKWPGDYGLLLKDDAATALKNYHSLMNHGMSRNTEIRSPEAAAAA